MKTKPYTVRLPEKQGAEVEKFAEKMGLSTNQLMVNLVNVGLDDLRMLNSVGLLVVGRGLRDLVEKIRSGEIKVNGQGELPI